MTEAMAFFGMRPFEIRTPARQSLPFIFNSPHSGRHYPAEFLEMSRLDAKAIRRSEDYFVDELFHAAPEAGAPMMVAHFPRSYLDVNREPYELDPRMFDKKVPPYANVNSLRVAGGLGTVPRLVSENMEIYKQRLPLEDALSRIEKIYRPYHACLRRLIARTHVKFGNSVLVDCHSMPSNIRIPANQTRPDFIIGDRYGTSAHASLSQMAAILLEDMGYTVARNKPYAGGFITEHYGRPGRGLHAIQIEINRGLYIDEKTLKKRHDFHLLQNDLSTFVRDLTTFWVAESDSRPLAAE